MARTEDAIKRPRLGWDTRTVGRAWPSGGKVKELISSVCGHAVCIHAVGKNAVYAGSFKPTRVVINTAEQATAAAEILNCLEVEFLCKLSTMYKWICLWCGVGKGYSSRIWVGWVFYMCC